MIPVSVWVIIGITLPVMFYGLYLQFVEGDDILFVPSILCTVLLWIAFVRTPFHKMRLIDLEMIKPDFEKAMARCDKMIADHPDYFGGYWLRAAVNVEMNRTTEALNDCKRALAAKSINETEAAAIFSISCYIFALQDKEAEFRADAEQMLKLGKPHSMNLLNYASGLLFLEKTDEARTQLLQLDELCRNQPIRVEAQLNASWALLDLLEDNIDQAWSRMDKALRLWPEYPRLLTGRGLVRLKQGAPEEAIEDFSKAIEGNKYSFDAYWLRHFANKQMGNEDAAAADLAVTSKEAYLPPKVLCKLIA
jgi:tetratricopeptide (TPR) repeat protein